MRLLAISEHYFPRVGGTVNYVHETLSALTGLGIKVELLVPGPKPEHWPPQGMSLPLYQVRWVDAGYPAKGDPSRDQRYDFCRKVDALAFEAANGPKRPDLLHVVFGLFVMETLDTARLRAVDLPCVATVHNVPPMECSLVPESAPWLARIKETFRLRAVAMKNAARLKRHDYDLYVVPCEQVRDLLKAVISAPTAVIGHGPTGDLQTLMQPPPTRRPETGAPVRLLTAGGYAPHKRQHLIPEVADWLRAANVSFEWDIVGPSGRITGYYDGIVADVVRRGLSNMVRVRTAVPFAELAALYDCAHLYVQPSIEEGFCITALDAAAAGLPVIASSAGALVRIAQASHGTVVKSAPEPLAIAIKELALKDRWSDAIAQMQSVRCEFSWNKAARDLMDHYTTLADPHVTNYE